MIVQSFTGGAFAENGYLLVSADGASAAVVDPGASAPALSAAVRRVPAGALRRALAAGLAAAALVLPARVVFAHVRARLEPDTATRLARWIERELDPASDRILFNPTACVPLEAALEFEPGSPLEKIHRLRPWPPPRAFEPPRPESAFALVPLAVPPEELPARLGPSESLERLLRRVRATGCGWAVLVVRPEQPAYRLFRSALLRLGEPVQRFTPLRDRASREPTPTYYGPRMAALTLGLVRTGATFEVFRIGPPAGRDAGGQ